MRGNVYVLVYGSAEEVEEGPKEKEEFEGRIEEYSKSLGRDALKVVVGNRGGKERKRMFY